MKIENGAIKVEGGLVRVNVNRGVKVVGRVDQEEFRWPSKTNLNIFGEVMSIYKPYVHPELEVLILDTPEGLTRIIGSHFGDIKVGSIVELKGLRLRRMFEGLADYSFSLDGEVEEIERREKPCGYMGIHDVYFFLSQEGSGYVNICGSVFVSGTRKFLCGNEFCIPIRGELPSNGDLCLLGVGATLLGGGRPTIFFDSYSGIGQCECVAQEPPLIKDFYYYMAVRNADVKVESGEELPVLISIGSRKVRSGAWLVGEVGGAPDPTTIKSYLDGRVIGAVWTGEYFRLKTII